MKMYTSAAEVIGVHTFPPKGGDLGFTENGTVLGENAADESYIVMDVTNLSPVCVSVLWKFWDEGSRFEAESLKMGLLPGLKTRLAVPVSALRGNTLFLRRTPGKLKTVVQGRPIDPKNIKKFSVGLDKAPIETKIEIHSLYVSKEKPDFPLSGAPLVDSLGQKAAARWKGKTENEEAMISFLGAELFKPAPEASRGYGKFGGNRAKRFEPTGYFSLKKENGVYWLADPEGYAFFSTGADCVGIGGECNIEGIESLCSELDERGFLRRGSYSWSKVNLQRAFGDGWYDSWAKITARRLREWGCNTVACWSDPRFIESAALPYVYIMNGFPKAEKYIFRDFPDVFDPSYAESSRRWAAQLEEKKNDPFMVGYFMSNEPQWAFVDSLNIAKMTLESREFFHSKEKLISLLREKYGDISALNERWELNLNDFGDLAKGVSVFNSAAEADTMKLSEEMIREFVRVPATAIKETDKNHLNLGMRYAWLSGSALAAGKEYFDVFSFNCYRHDPLPAIERMVEMVKMPVMIGEFHFGAADRGLDATGIQAVACQEDRARAYRYYMHRCASHPYCLGAHYFQYADQPYLGRFDGENYQIGLVDVCHRPYKEFTEGMAKTNAEVYSVRMGELPPCEDIPPETESIFY